MGRTNGLMPPALQSYRVNPMIVDIVWWNLDGSTQTIDSLRNHLCEDMFERWRKVPGLRLKFWIADAEANRWGAVMLWDEARPPSYLMPENKAQHLIGLPITQRARFSVDALVEGEKSLRHAGPSSSSSPLPGAAVRMAERAQGIDYIVVDAFTRSPLQGNPVAVFLIKQALPAERMQQIAREMNLSEVTFVMPPEQDGDVRVRIFTPVNELPFAGHPLLGTAVALRQLREQEQFRFETGVGTVTFEVRPEEAGLAFVTMQQPIPTWQPYEHAARLLEGLGLSSSTMPVEAYRNGPRHVLVGCPDVASLSAVRPDLRILAEFEDMSAICLAPADDHWRCRMFSPAYGVAEDAATGSAAGPIAIHLARHGQAPWGRALHILQGVEMARPSHMYALAAGSEHGIRSVKVSGYGVVVARGQLHA